MAGRAEVTFTVWLFLQGEDVTVYGWNLREAIVMRRGELALLGASAGAMLLLGLVALLVRKKRRTFTGRERKTGTEGGVNLREIVPGNRVLAGVGSSSSSSCGRFCEDGVTSLTPLRQSGSSPSREEKKRRRPAMDEGDEDDPPAEVTSRSCARKWCGSRSTDGECEYSQSLTVDVWFVKTETDGGREHEFTPPDILRCEREASSFQSEADPGSLRTIPEDADADCDVTHRLRDEDVTGCPYFGVEKFDERRAGANMATVSTTTVANDNEISDDEDRITVEEDGLLTCDNLDFCPLRRNYSSNGFETGSPSTRNYIWGSDRRPPLGSRTGDPQGGVRTGDETVRGRGNLEASRGRVTGINRGDRTNKDPVYGGGWKHCRSEACVAGSGVTSKPKAGQRDEFGTTV